MERLQSVIIGSLDDDKAENVVTLDLAGLSYPSRNPHIDWGPCIAIPLRGTHADSAVIVAARTAGAAPFDESLTPLVTAFVDQATLALDIPDQLVYELKEPDKDGRRQFVLTDKVAVSFKKDDKGKVVAMLLYQAGLTFEMPRDKPAAAEPAKK